MTKIANTRITTRQRYDVLFAQAQIQQGVAVTGLRRVEHSAERMEKALIILSGGASLATTLLALFSIL